MDHCRTPGCGAEVIFVPSAKTGRPMILDAKPEKHVVLVHVEGLPAGAASPIARFDKLCKHEPGYIGCPDQVARVIDVYTDHHVTCPGAKDWRGRTRKQPPLRPLAIVDDRTPEQLATDGDDVATVATVTTIGDEEYLSMHCRAGRHGVCLWTYGGHRCSCPCGHPAVAEAPKGPGVFA